METSEKIKIGKKNIKYVFSEDGNDYFHLCFKTKTEVSNFYDWLLTTKKVEVIKTNFAGNPCEWASFIVFKLNGAEYLINPPKAKNGDNNWFSYKDDFGFYSELVTKSSGLS